MVLKGIESFRERKGYNPRPKELIEETGSRGGVIGGLIRRMRNEGLLERRVKGSSSQVYISLKGYRFLEKNGNIKEVSESKKVLTLPKQVAVLDNKDRYIEFIEWLYEVDENMLLENGWKKEVLSKIKSLFL